MPPISSRFSGSHRSIGQRAAPPARKLRLTPVMLIGMVMGGLILAYVGVFLRFAYTMHQHANNTANNNNASKLRVGNTTLHLPSNFKKHLEAAAAAKQQQGGEQKEEPKHKPSPFRTFHLEDGFGHGVEPVELLQADQAPVTLKDDGPLDQHPTPNNVLTAYIEPIDYKSWETQPLPIRKATEPLRSISYSRLNSCSKLIQQWPVDDTPADEDPFLPWIHDVFPTADGKFVQFVAQNKRRCKTGKKEGPIMDKMQPQLSLFQHVSVQRVLPENRYKLVPYEEADADGITTRFICRFKPSMEETLAVHNIDYDWTAHRKLYKKGFQPDDGGIYSIHTSQLLFKCPVPASLVETVRTGASVTNDWASLFVDLIPIRTPPRFGPPNQYLAPWFQEDSNPSEPFDPVAAWGDHHVLPPIEESGRWENIPICQPSLMTFEQQTPEQALAVQDEPVKKHRLVSCLWASSGYTTRGNRFAVNDGQRRLLEWINYNKEIGWDHFYVYDNSGAFRNDTSLKPIADLFPDDVTYVPWPSQICNNNPNNVDSVGERSSQYAAESSCRLRFGPHVEWIGQFDIDEYLVPMGQHKNITSLLDELEQEDTRIISFSSWRAWPRAEFIEPPEPITDPEVCWSKEPCFDLRIPVQNTMLQSYNCDRQKPGKKKSAMPAEKQLYRPDYVLQHFVHYSAATVLSMMNRTGYTKEGFGWKSRAFPDPRQRFGNEETEGLMIHTKAVAHQDTVNWEQVCKKDILQQPARRRGLCRLGFPWPNGQDSNDTIADDEGWMYNCFVNRQVEDYLVPKLRKRLEKYAHLFDPPKQEEEAAR